LSNVSTIATTGNVTAGGLLQLAGVGVRFSDASTLTSAAGIVRNPMTADIDANLMHIGNLRSLQLNSSLTGTLDSAVVLQNINAGAQVLAGVVRLTVANGLNNNSFLTMISAAGTPQIKTRFDFRADGSLYIEGSITITNGGINAPNYSGLTFAGNQTAPGAHQILRSSSDSYTYLGWINTPSGDAGATPFSRVYASYDNFIRYYTLANFSAQLTPDWSKITNKPTIVAANGTPIPGRLSIYNPTASLAMTSAGIEIREVNGVVNTQTSWDYAPRIAFHWGNQVAVQMGVDSAGQVRVMNAGSTGYVDFGCSSLIAAANVVAGGVIQAASDISAPGFQSISVAGSAGILIGEGVGNNQFCRVQWNTTSNFLEFAFAPGGAKMWLSSAYVIMSLPTSSVGLPTGALWRSGVDVKIV
jgi:hypothetical protein